MAGGSNICDFYLTPNALISDWTLSKAEASNPRIAAMVSPGGQDPHWLSLYGSNIYDWKRIEDADGEFYYRRHGIVENLFDIDGIDYEGRADINMNLDIRMSTKLTDTELRHRIVLAWALMRHQHTLLSSKSLYASEFLATHSRKQWIDKCFVYRRPRHVAETLAQAMKSITFVEDEHPGVQNDDFYLHVMNTARVFDSKVNLSRLFVLPIKQTTSNSANLRLTLVVAHQCADGLTVFRWANHLIDILNMPETDVRSTIQSLCVAKQELQNVLPLAQESLYPNIASNVQRLRWKWLIIRLLRYVQKPLPPAFQNPLSRDQPLMGAESLRPVYHKILDYGRKPPLNCFSITAGLSKRATHNLIRLCREAKISIGSGSFTLVGLVMMRFEEMRHPDIPLQDRLPFVGSFPVNPRPFLSGVPTTGKEDSLMLAFSSGVVLPFLPDNLDLSMRFKVLGRLAHRQLRQYQKRPRTAEDGLQLGSRNPDLLLPMLYLSTMERLNGMVKPHQRVNFNPQGQYGAGKHLELPKRIDADKPVSRATCGISSVGDRTNLISDGRYNVDDLGDKDLAADFCELKSCVRSRDGEFLVGAIGTKDRLEFAVSYDGSSIDPEKAHQWQAMIEKILDYDMAATPPADISTRTKPRL